MSAPAAFRKLLKQKGIIVMPGCYNPITARIAERVGFSAAYISGGAVTTSLALPDIELLTSSEMALHARYITRATSIPLIADADTGYGSVHSVARTIEQFEEAGLAGLHLEDQESPKKCGHLKDKTLVSTEEMCQRIAAAVEARKDKDFLIMARTDAAASEGFDAALERTQEYVKAGADAIFPEALTTVDEFREFAKRLKVPLLANMTEFGKTPYLKAKEFEKMGYKMVIFPVTAMNITLQSVQDLFLELKEEGTQEHVLDLLMTRDERYELLDYAAYEKRDKSLAKK